jgi:phosphatidylethanolamine-binding protein (PEBP) family uncharacterized protein
MSGLGLLLLLSLALAGCGGGSESDSTTAASAPASTSSTPSAPASTATQPASTTSSTQPASTTSAGGAASKSEEEEPGPSQEKVEISSPVVAEGGQLPARYTCDGQDAALPLRWRGIPPGTRGLLMEIIKVGLVKGRLSFDWALTGMKPSSTGVGSGALPAGTIVGRNGFGREGYSICQPHGTSEKYVVVLFALTRKLPAKPGFDPLALRRQAIRHSKYEGFLTFSYTSH